MDNGIPDIVEANVNETKYCYLDRAAYLRGLAGEAQSPQLRKSCLKAAADYDALAEKAEKESPGVGARGNWELGPRH
ncbi:MAG TPA: hypothetical protein VH189_12085 [Rhizomicrobium sp.]|nr:hypothetical protein [Rhizomicrobium sp.]